MTLPINEANMTINLTTIKTEYIFNIKNKLRNRKKKCYMAPKQQRILYFIRIIFNLSGEKKKLYKIIREKKKCSKTLF